MCTRHIKYHFRKMSFFRSFNSPNKVPLHVFLAVQSGHVFTQLHTLSTGMCKRSPESMTCVWVVESVRLLILCLCKTLSVNTILCLWGLLSIFGVEGRGERKIIYLGVRVLPNTIMEKNSRLIYYRQKNDFLSSYVYVLFVDTS